MKRALLCALLLCNPAYAEAPQNTNIAGPTASATGNVTNQAVQVLQGPYPMSQFGGGIACPGPALTVAPFVTGGISNNTDPGTYQNNSSNMGITIGFSTPLNGAITEECLAGARVWRERNQAEADKARLDFELVRAIRCGALIKRGVRFHPASPYAAICADIIVIQPPAPPKPEFELPNWRINTNPSPVNNETPVSEGKGQKIPTTNQGSAVRTRP